MRTDTADWDAALRGDGEAFARLFRRHRDRVFRHARYLTGGDADADDVVAVAFFEAWRLRSRVRFVDDSIIPWLLNVATNVARNQLRASRRYREMLDRLPTPDQRPAPSSEEIEAVTLIRGLAPRYRDVAVLCLVEGYSERETAQALGIKPGTVKSRLSVARARLRTQLSAGPTDKEPNHAW